MPAKPPPPTPWNLPFQFDAGIHTSKFTAGLTTPVTRHASTGIWKVCGFCVADAGVVVKGPAGTSVADRIVVSANESDVRLSHVAAFTETALRASKKVVNMAADSSRSRFKGSRVQRFKGRVQ